MVRYIALYSVLLLISSCNDRPEPPKNEASFDVSEFKLDAFTKRVQHFLHDRKETQSELNYNALFVNTENCTACMRGAFEGLTPYLSTTTTRTFVYFNDSSILQLAPKNAYLNFICLPLAEFHTKDILHSKIYLYRVENDAITAQALTLDVVDSLNNVNSSSSN
jgi:hypothetical protein